MINQSAHRAADLIRKLLAFSKQGTHLTTGIDVHEILRDAVAILERTVDKRNRIECRFSASKSMVLGDAAQLESVFLNLGLNATQAMPGGGTLTITTETITPDAAKSMIPSDAMPPSGPLIEIRFCDTGCGIRSEHLERIFEPFFTTRESEGGNGLGLAVAYGIIRHHLGVIQVESKPGEGACFRILLPVNLKTTTKPRKTDASPVPGTGRILIVDDEPSVRITLQEMLHKLGYDTVLASDGREGIDIFSREPSRIGLVILDVNMPNMNGIECLAKMKEIQPDIKVIVVSGFTGGTGIRNFDPSDVCAFIDKPYTIGDISRILNRELNRNPGSIASSVTDRPYRRFG
jgi:CheY-like chemotaxis protein